jgi:hypothetical protein
MKRYEVHFSKHINDKFPDVWKFEKVEAETEEKAIDKIFQNHQGKVNYVLSCTELS